MLEAAEKIVQFATGMSLERLEADELRQLALMRLIEIIGEASKQTSPEFREQHPEIEWQSIAGMRNRLIHGYDSVNLELLWRTCTDDVPRLVTQLRAILQ